MGNPIYEFFKWRQLSGFFNVPGNICVLLFTSSSKKTSHLSYFSVEQMQGSSYLAQKHVA